MNGFAARSPASRRACTRSGSCRRVPGWWRVAFGRVYAQGNSVVQGIARGGDLEHAHVVEGARAGIEVGDRSRRRPAASRQLNGVGTRLQIDGVPRRQLPRRSARDRPTRPRCRPSRSTYQLRRRCPSRSGFDRDWRRRDPSLAWIQEGGSLATRSLTQISPHRYAFLYPTEARSLAPASVV